MVNTPEMMKRRLREGVEFFRCPRERRAELRMQQKVPRSAAARRLIEL